MYDQPFLQWTDGWEIIYARHIYGSLEDPVVWIPKDGWEIAFILASQSLFQNLDLAEKVVVSLTLLAQQHRAKV